MSANPLDPFELRPSELWKRHRKGWVAILLLLTVSTTLVSKNGQYLQLSVLTKPEAVSFDGATYPVPQVPDWLNTSAEEQDMTYAEIPADKLMPLPSYDPSRLQTDTNALEWGDDYDDYTRQMKLTYPVLYAGNYELDGVQGAGSHAGVDIKGLQGTPIIAVMNGVVETASWSSGFGNLVVLKHTDVPSPEDDSSTTTLYSGYAHLDTILVTDGEVVSKGQVIGTMGMTGTATTEHLHFQMDNDTAPWHLYWPFTTAEANAVGGFFEAVNQGVGQDRVYAYTENPLEYVEKYMDASSLSVDKIEEFSTESIATVETTTTEEITTVEEVEETEETTEEIEVELTEEIEEVEIVEDEEDSGLPFEGIAVDAPSYVLRKDQAITLISLQDEVGELVRMPTFNAPITVTVADPSVLEVFPMEFNSHNFTTGEATLNMVGLQNGTTTVTLSFNDQVSTAFEVIVTDTLKPVASFAIETESDFYVGQAHEVAIVALDAAGQRVPEVDLDSITLQVAQGEGSFSRSTLTGDDFESGIAVVWFTPDSETEVVLQAFSGTLFGTSSKLAPGLFGDLETDHPYYQAIEYLKKTDVISGYPDGTFRPDYPVSRVEAMKLIFEGLNKEVAEGVTLNFSDTVSSDWYAPYVASAQRDGIIEGYPDGSFRPANEVNRVEFIKMLAGAMGVDVDPVVIGNPYDDVHYLEWYAPYAQFVKTTNIAPWDEEVLNPGNAMTRAEVAEMIYRVLAIQANEADSYSRTMVLE